MPQVRNISYQGISGSINNEDCKVDRLKDARGAVNGKKKHIPFENGVVQP